MSAPPVMIPAPVLTPHGSLTLADTGEALALDAERGARLQQAFARGSGHGLLSLGIDEIGAVLPPVLSYWRERRQANRPPSGRQYVGQDGGGRPAHDRRGVPDGGCARRSLAKRGCGVR